MLGLCDPGTSYGTSHQHRWLFLFRGSVRSFLTVGSPSQQPTIVDLYLLHLKNYCYHAIVNYFFWAVSIRYTHDKSNYYHIWPTDIGKNGALCGSFMLALLNELEPNYYKPERTGPSQPPSREGPCSVTERKKKIENQS